MRYSSRDDHTTATPLHHHLHHHTSPLTSLPHSASLPHSGFFSEITLSPVTSPTSPITARMFASPT
ncbi:hypothetical protein E2C01_100514 [Portunus trituberculatus]|uniref:Uncharacterized protein n=2 Tax=Portunus trituberculatus TaxID=210409 RepID=A0A5B7KJM4_PORTR|nr:hypothetical protein [Portunus trituberculatus]